MIILNGLNLLKEISSIEEKIKKMETLLKNQNIDSQKEEILTRLIKTKMM